MAKAGRPELYNHEVQEKILDLYKQGKTNQQVAEVIGVHVRTIENWLRNKQQLLWAVRENKQLADEIVEASLYSRATGYSVDSVKIFCGKDGEIIEAPFIEHYPPDVNAAQFWLKNRKPKDWREKTEVEVTNTSLADKVNKARSKAKK